jgi:ApbE superfamily uncharacterized protein (UPF0280 family)
VSGAQVSWLPDGRRLHMNHGPIDLIVEAFGADDERQAAYEQAASRFATILEELVAELPELRRPAGAAPRVFAGAAARAMEAAACRFADAGRTFATPMAAVAGAVADAVLAAMVAGRRLDRAYVNDGGDVALHLSPGQSLRLAIGGKDEALCDRVLVRAEDGVRGIATSGWRGRSHSFGIADAVTVLAHDAASADVAATLIANAVDLPGHPAVLRRPATALAPDSDLGERLVTVAVGTLSLDEVDEALGRGAAVAEVFYRRGWIAGAVLFLAGEGRVCGGVADRLALRDTPLWPAGHLPLRGGDRMSPRPSPIFDVAGDAPTQQPPISPLEGEMAGRPEGGIVERHPCGRQTYRKEAEHA